MNEPNEFPSYDQPLSTNYQQGSYPASTFQGNAPALPVGPPPVARWYKVYAAFMMVLYFACIVGGVLLLKYTPFLISNAPNISPVELKIRAVIMLVIGIVLFIAYLVALVLPNTSGAWVYHLVMIAIGLTSCCLWPATIPLMINWIKPETQRFFGRTDAGAMPPSNPNYPPPPIPSV